MIGSGRTRGEWQMTTRRGVKPRVRRCGRGGRKSNVSSFSSRDEKRPPLPPTNRRVAFSISFRGNSMPRPAEFRRRIELRGLPQVYSFAKQSEGQLALASVIIGGRLRDSSRGGIPRHFRRLCPTRVPITPPGHSHPRNGRVRFELSRREYRVFDSSKYRIIEASFCTAWSDNVRYCKENYSCNCYYLISIRTCFIIAYNFNKSFINK